MGTDENGVSKGLQAASREAQQGLVEGGIPIGAALLKHGEIVSTGRNQRVQKGSQILHGEMQCIEAAGRSSLRGMTIVTTLSPCMMCSGAIVQFGISKVVIGDNKNFDGNEEFLRSRGIEVEVVNDYDLVEMMKKFIVENDALWHEDIGE